MINYKTSIMAVGNGKKTVAVVAEVNGKEFKYSIDIPINVNEERTIQLAKDELFFILPEEELNKLANFFTG